MGSSGSQPQAPPHERLRAEYSEVRERAQRLKDSVPEQLGELLRREEIALGVPMESRVKSWTSIEQKIGRRQLELKTIEDVDDLVGVRVILLFRVDLIRTVELIRRTFEVVSSEDTAERLSEVEFGYQSHHFVVRLPVSWLETPTMKRLSGLKVELQVRTLAQHIWAAASHKLQYKSEATVPRPVQRAIHRVSALLEVVDLELDRVLMEREAYRREEVLKGPTLEPLNVDSLATMLSKVWPQDREGEDDYAYLLEILHNLGVGTSNDLFRILAESAPGAEEEVREWTGELTHGQRLTVFPSGRPSQVDLTLWVLEKEFGPKELTHAVRWGRVDTQVEL